MEWFWGVTNEYSQDIACFTASDFTAYRCDGGKGFLDRGYTQFPSLPPGKCSNFL